MTVEQKRIAIAEQLGWQFTDWGKKQIRIDAPKGYMSASWLNGDPDSPAIMPWWAVTFEDAKARCAKYVPDFFST